MLPSRLAPPVAPRYHPGRMGKPRNAWVDLLQYIGLRTVSMALHSFPIDANLQTAKLLGSLVYRFDKKHRDRSLGNLRRSFPAISQRQREQLARRSVQQLIMLFVEVLFTTRLIRIDTWPRFVELENFDQVIKLLMQRGRGLILLTGHYGNWEILGYVLATLGFETTSVARPMDNPYVNRWLLGVRERQGQRIIAKKGATTEVTEVLAAGGAVGFIADQNAGSKGVFVDFFGDALQRAGGDRLCPPPGSVFSLQDRRPGHHLPRRLENAGRPASLHHTALHQGDRRHGARRPGPIPLGASTMENPAQRRSGGDV